MSAAGRSHKRWQIILGIVLFTAAVLLHMLHYLLFRDFHHIAIYFLGDLAFIPFDILLVVLILNRLLSSREKSARLSKMNMVVSVFFSELGRPLLRSFLKMDGNSRRLASVMRPETGWSAKSFAAAMQEATNHQHDFGGPCSSQTQCLAEMKLFLLAKRPFLLSLMENPTLLEHESFSDLLLAVFHLIDELLEREDLASCGDSDLRHLTGDAVRAYRALMTEWLSYMRHIKREYPYLFSLSLRTNPFDPEASAQIP